MLMHIKLKPKFGPSYGYFPDPYLANFTNLVSDAFTIDNILLLCFYCIEHICCLWSLLFEGVIGEDTSCENLIQLNGWSMP